MDGLVVFFFDGYKLNKGIVMMVWFWYDWYFGRVMLLLWRLYFLNKKVGNFLLREERGRIFEMEIGLGYLEWTGLVVFDYNMKEKECEWIRINLICC